jgi:anthranilate phosphoribosyltransferase
MNSFDHNLKKLLNHEDLSFDEAAGSMEEIMKGTVSPVKLAAWLTALRMKGESPREIAGCASIMQKYAKKIHCHYPDAVDLVGTGGDGTHTINISTAACFVAAGAGITIAKHGNRSVSSKSGSADVLEALGININISSEKMEHCLNKTGIAFLFAPLLHPAMKHAMPVRREMGIRTIFNILGPLSNPARVKRLVIGVYEDRLCKLIASSMHDLDIIHGLVVHGNDGLDELTTTGNTHVCEIKKGLSLNDYQLNPKELGIPLAESSDLTGGTAKENAEIILNVLNGDLSGPKLDIILLNAAAAIYVSGKADGWQDSLELAKESVQSGRAIAKLRELATVSSE